MMKRILSLLVAAMLLWLSGVAVAEETENPYAHLDLSNPETVTIYFVGTPGEDWERVTGMANELMAKKINTTVNWVHISWADFQANYALYLSGSEDVDIIYGASWCNYMDYVKSGAFKPLSQDFLQTYMPMTLQNQAPASWNEVSYLGDIYGVPTNYSAIEQTVVVTPREYLTKYGYQEEDINSMDKLVEYLAKVAEGEKGTGVYGLNCQSNFPTNFYWLPLIYHNFDLDTASATWMMWDYDKGDFKVEDLHWWADSEDFVQYALDMAELNKLGVFPPNVIANENFLGDNFEAGTSVIDFVGCAAADARIADWAAKGKDLAVLDVFSTENMHSRRGNYMGYCAAFPINSTKTERAAVALDCIKNDREVNLLLLGGIEGEHIIYDWENNTYRPGPNATAYPWNSWFHCHENDSNPHLAIANPRLAEINQRYIDAAVDSFPVNGFTYDGSKYQAEIAILNSLMQEYQWSFCFGIFGDETEAKCAQFLQEARLAGLDLVVEDYRQQLAAYLGQE